MIESVLTDEQIEKGRQEVFSTSNPFCPCDSKTMRKAARWTELAVLQSPGVQKLQRDADLWRFFIGNYDEYGTVGFIDGATLKTAIGAAMEKKE